MGLKSEQEDWRRIDHRRDGALHRAALRLSALRLLDRLLALLRLLGFLAAGPADRLARKRRRRPQGRHCDCADDEPPLHAAQVTTQSMNGK